MDIFLVNSDNPHAESLMHKLAEDQTTGRIIPLNDGEMELYCSPDFNQVIFGNDSKPSFTEVEPGRKYIFVVNQDVVIDDIIKAGDRLGIEIGIIRTRT